MNRIIMDTGPLVAWFCPRDEHFRWAEQTFPKINPGGIICEAVLTEACHLVAKEGVNARKIFEFIAAAELEVIPLGGELPAIDDLMKRYADAPMDFADACIVRLAELHPHTGICTTDGHFRFFRKSGPENIPLIAPFSA